MAKKGKLADPHAEREAARYDNPIPSREVILELLSEADEPLNHNQIARQLMLEDQQQTEALRKRLRAMERDGQLLGNRRGAYGLVDKMDLVHCRVQGHRDGYGFAMPVGEGEDIYLSARQMQFVFDGDEALVAVTGLDRRGRQEGQVIEVLDRGNRTVVGRFEEESGIGSVIPDNSRINHHMLIPPGEEGDAPAGTDRQRHHHRLSHPQPQCQGAGDRGAGRGTWTRAWRSTWPFAPTAFPGSGRRRWWRRPDTWKRSRVRPTSSTG